MTSDGTGVGAHTYRWDAEGRLTSVGGTGCSAASYTYNALGQRVEKLVGSTYTEIVYGLGGQPIGYHNRTDWTDQFFYLGAAPFAKYQGGVTYFIHGNHLGSTSMVFNHTGGTVAQDEIFYPWGERWDYAGTVYDERFASLGRRDAETGNDPTLFRMYNSRFYRWLSPDPVAGSIFDPQSLNRYAYVLNNPVNFIDPLGLQGQPNHPLSCAGGDSWACVEKYFCGTLYCGYSLDQWVATSMEFRLLEIPVIEYFFGSWSSGPGEPAEVGMWERNWGTLLVMNEAGGCGAGGGSGKQETLNKMTGKAWACLLKDPDCLWWLGSLGGDPLARLDPNNFTVQDLGPGGPSAGTPVSSSGPLRAGQTVVNSQGAFFATGYVFQGASQIPSGTPQGQGLILLHEVGHAMGVLGRDPTHAGQKASNQAVVSHCSKAIECMGGQ